MFGIFLYAEPGYGGKLSDRTCLKLSNLHKKLEINNADVLADGILEISKHYFYCRYTNKTV